MIGNGCTLRDAFASLFLLLIFTALAVLATSSSALARTLVTTLPDASRFVLIDGNNFVQLGQLSAVEPDSGAEGAYDVAIMRDGKRAFVTNSTLGDSNVAQKHVSVIDLDPASDNYTKVIKTIEVGNTDHAKPRAIAISPASDMAYVANYDDNTVSVINTKSNTYVQEIGLGDEQHPLGLAVSTDGKRLYVANNGSEDGDEDPGSVSVVDLKTFKVMNVLEAEPLFESKVPDGLDAVPAHPMAVAVTPGGGRAFVASRNLKSLEGMAPMKGLLTVLDIGDPDDPFSAQIYDVMHLTGTVPLSVAVAPLGGSAYTANFATESLTDIAFNSDEKSYSTSYIETVGFPLDVAVAPDGKSLFSSGFGISGDSLFGFVASYDTATKKIVDSLDLGDAAASTAVVPNQLPTLTALQADAAAAKAGQPVKLEAVGAQDPDGEVVKYRWSFSDSPGKSYQFTSGPTIEHAFAGPGEFKATVMAIDNDESFDKPIYNGQMFIHYGKSGAGTKSITIDVVPADDGISSGDGQACAKSSFSLSVATDRSVKLGKLLKRGLKAKVAASHAAKASFKLLLDGKSKKKLKLKALLATKKVALKAGKKTVKLKLRKKAKKALQRALNARPVKGKLGLKLKAVAQVKGQPVKHKLTLSPKAKARGKSGKKKIVKTSTKTKVAKC